MAAPEPDEGVPGDLPRNFVILTIYQVFLRIGWIFKTETIVMPLFLMHVGASSAMLGWLPVFNRIGLSVPPLLYSRQLKLAPLKKWPVAISTFAMAIPFAILSTVWFSGVWKTEGGTAAWMPYLFLVLYAIFFCLTGMNQLGVHSLQGKLVSAERRGRLFAASVLVGTPLAIYAAYALLPKWLKQDDGGFGMIFAAVALFFVLAALSIVVSREASDNFSEAATSPRQKFLAAWRLVRHEPDCQRLGILAALMSATFALFPHYTSLGREQMDLGIEVIMPLVVVQNLSTALFSLIAGPLADRLGNRSALRLTVSCLATAPLIAITLAQLPPTDGKAWFWLIFIPLGITPVTLRFLINYTLEISPTEEHPKYVSAIGMCLATPVIFGSPLVGLLVGQFGSVPIFIGGFLLMVLAGVQTLRLSEPRHTK